jgi:hypothetical protein
LPKELDICHTFNVRFNLIRRKVRNHDVQVSSSLNAPCCNPKSKIENPKSLVFLRIEARDLAKEGAEEEIVVLDAVVEVNRNLLDGDFEQRLLVVFELLKLLFDGGDLFDGLRRFRLGGIGAVGGHLAMLGVVSEPVAEVTYAFKNLASGFGTVAVHRVPMREDLPSRFPVPESVWGNTEILRCIRDFHEVAKLVHDGLQSKKNSLDTQTLPKIN